MHFQETLGFSVAHTAIQLALVDCLTAAGVQPTGILGYSIGELACAYADQCLTFEQTLLIAYQRAQLIHEARLPSGAMATLSLTWEQAQKRCPAGVSLACHNFDNNVTVSGPLAAVRKLVEELAKEKIHATILNTHEIAYHSQYMTSLAGQLKKRLEKIITSPKARSAKWLSTSFGQQRWTSELAKHASAEYFVNNLCSHVLLRETMSQIPVNAIVVEIGPQSVMEAIVSANLAKGIYFPLMVQRQEQTEQQLINFWTQLGNLYVRGVEVQPMRLFASYSSVYPVPVSTRFLRARAGQEQYRQCVDEARELKSQLEKKYECLLSGDGVKSVDCKKCFTQYMQTYQQEKLVLVKCFVRHQELNVQQKKCVEQLEALIKKTPLGEAELIAHFQQQLEVVQCLDLSCPRQEALQTRIIQDLKEIICEQIKYCRQTEVTRRVMEKHQQRQYQTEEEYKQCHVEGERKQCNLEGERKQCNVEGERKQYQAEGHQQVKIHKFTMNLCYELVNY